MEKPIFWPESFDLDFTRARELMWFMQGMAYRFVQGAYRYGNPKRSKRYFSRLKLEVDAYDKTGNAEHLRNIANYCGLEFIAPENKLFHDDPTVDSATRGKI